LSYRREGSSIPSRRNPRCPGTDPVGGWCGLKKGLRGRFGNCVPPVLEVLGPVEVEHSRATTAGAI